MTRLFAGTEWDRPPRCERCGALEQTCECPPAQPAQPAQGQTAPQTQTAKIVVEKRKRGKQVSVVRGLAAHDNDLPALLTQLKTHCGAGGTLKDDQIEIQGDHRQRMEKLLAQIGYRIVS
ncbi:MAG: translation initiation factor [Bythopirellula sp.]